MSEALSFKGFALWLLAPACIIVAATSTAPQSVTGQLDAIGKLSVPAGVILTNSISPFTAYSGTLTITHRVRTTVGGGGAITAQVTSDFQPAGGPSVLKGVLTYTCTSASLGTPCSGAQTASSTSQTPVLSIPGGTCTGGGSPCSSTDPNSVQAQFSLVNDPAYRSGTYSAQITFTISAL